MAMKEVRSFKANCQGCTNPQCVNGDSPVPDPSDTFALRGCTMGLKNNQLRDMGHVSTFFFSYAMINSMAKAMPNVPLPSTPPHPPVSALCVCHASKIVIKKCPRSTRDR